MLKRGSIIHLGTYFCTGEMANEVNINIRVDHLTVEQCHLFCVGVTYFQGLT